MELSDKLKYCAICRNSKRDIERGIVCGLTNEKPVFDKHCADLQASAHEIAELEESLIGGSQKSATKIMTAVIIVIFAIAMGVMWLIHNIDDRTAQAAAKNAEMKYNALESIVKAKMATLPQTINGIVFDSISLHKKYVEFTLRLPNTYIQDYPDDRLICESKFRHSEALKYLPNEDSILLKACLDDSLQIRYAFRESANFSIYTIVIHPQDMEQALNPTGPFRCPRKDFDRVLRSDNKAIPFDIVNKIQLSAIKMDYSANKLTLNLRSRRKDITKGPATENLVKTDLWKNANDLYAVKMLILNEGTIDFRFIGTDDRLVESIVIGPDFYQNK
ncbi:MAG: hypothetical protein IKO46_05605 [Salinivirgaceae bacterium]|nr:hypothetical protein [Salinivirgaceae bacterium]MBR3567253.1 hypothetical protein [Salinivirgaceae bacterium]MBR4620439.1 hypothetical protein [Salinivirgaceae bacterium]